MLHRYVFRVVDHQVHLLSRDKSRYLATKHILTDQPEALLKAAPGHGNIVDKKISSCGG